MSIRDELLLIKGDDDLLMPHKVVDWARKHPKSDLHSEIEWDDAKAGEKYRTWQVRRLIALHIVTEATGEREMISLSIDRVREGGYRDLADVIGNPDFRDVMLQDALRELQRIQTKYGRLKKLAGVWREISKATVKHRPSTKQEEHRPAVQA